MEGMSNVDMACLMKFSIKDLKTTCTSFDIECSTRDKMVRSVADVLMSLSEGIDQNIVSSLDLDLEDVHFDL